MIFKEGDLIVCIKEFNTYKIGDVTIIKKYRPGSNIDLYIPNKNNADEGNILTFICEPQLDTDYNKQANWDENWWKEYFNFHYSKEFNFKLDKLINE